MGAAQRLAALSLAISVAVPVTLTFDVQRAAADTTGCVSASEFRRVHNGMTRGAVHRLFDTSGKRLFENPGAVHNSAREYKICAAFRRTTGDRKVQIQYNNYASHGGPQRVVLKQHY